MTSNVFPVSYIEPCFLLSSPRFVFPIGFSLYLTLFPQQLSQSRSLFIVLLAPVNSCELHNYYLVLSFFLMYSLLFFSAWPGSGAPLSRYLEGALYKF